MDLRKRKDRISDEGLDGAPAETTHPDGYMRAHLEETTPNPAPRRLNVSNLASIPGLTSLGLGGGGVSSQARQLLGIRGYQ